MKEGEPKPNPWERVAQKLEELKEEDKHQSRPDEPESLEHQRRIEGIAARCRRKAKKQEGEEENERKGGDTP